MNFEDFDKATSADGVDYTFSACAEEQAERCGCVVVYPEPNQIQLDLDTDAAFSMYETRMTEFYSQCPDSRFTLACHPAVEPSKSGLPHRHVTLTFCSDLTELERICLQVMFGSDPIRESLNALRLFGGIERPTRLFELKV